MSQGPWRHEPDPEEAIPKKLRKLSPTVAGCFVIVVTAVILLAVIVAVAR